MLLKERKFTVEITEDDVKELCEALQERIDTLCEAAKTGGELTRKHLERSKDLFLAMDYLKSECINR